MGGGVESRVKDTQTKLINACKVGVLVVQNWPRFRKQFVVVFIIWIKQQSAIH